MPPAAGVFEERRQFQRNAAALSLFKSISYSALSRPLSRDAIQGPEDPALGGDPTAPSH